MVNIRDRITLKACRIIAGIKAEDIAAAVGVNVETLYKWERGESYPNGPQMAAYIQCFADNGYVVDFSDINFFVK